MTLPPPPPRVPPGPPPFGGAPPPLGPQPRSSRTAAIAVLVGAVVLAVVAVIVVLLVTSSDDDSTHRADSDRSSPATQSTSPTESPETADSATTASGTGTATTSPVADADRASALTFADDAAATILGYAYDDLDQHRIDAEALMTDQFARTWRTTFTQVEGQITQTKASVVVNNSGSGLIGIHDDAAEVMVFATERVTRAGGSPSLVPVTAVFTLRRDGDDWLVDDLATEAKATAATEHDPDRQAVLTAATNAAEAFISVDYRTIDADSQKLLDLSTGAFKSQYSKSLDDLKKLTRKARSVSTGEVAAAGIATYATDRATVLVAAGGTVTNATATQPARRTYRIRLDLELVNGAWLVADLQMVP